MFIYQKYAVFICVRQAKFYRAPCLAATENVLEIVGLGKVRVIDDRDQQRTY